MIKIAIIIVFLLETAKCVKEKGKKHRPKKQYLFSGKKENFINKIEIFL